MAASSYLERLLAELDEIESQYATVLMHSTIHENDWPEGFIGFAPYAWDEATDDLTTARMATLRSIRDFEPRFRLLFSDPTPEVAKRLKNGFAHLKRWVRRSGSDHSIPASRQEAEVAVKATVADLRELTTLLPADDWPVRLVVDTNALVDNPDLTIYLDDLGVRYMVHLLPVVLGEIDDLKRQGRNQEVRDAAKKADRRLKGLRDNGDVRMGARVAGEVYAVFEYTEPRSEGLPGWLDLSVPDDRLVASTLLLQSTHPGSTVHVATSDLNLQTKLAVVGLPHLEPPRVE